VLRSLEETLGYVLLAEDGDIGRCKDFLFDEDDWIVRQMVADTGKWIPHREVLISPTFLDEPDWPAKKLPVALTKSEIEGSPRPEPAVDEPALRSLGEVKGYDIAAEDGEIGHVEDLLVDDEEWTVRYLVVDTRNWLPGRKVLISPTWLVELDSEEERAVVDLKREQIENSPEYEPEKPIFRAFEASLHEGYGREGYWES